MRRKYKAVTPGQRHMLRRKKAQKIERAEYKQYIREGRIGGRKGSRGGRNETGRVTVRGRGGEEKRRRRTIDYRRREGQYSEGIVSSIQYNPSSTGQIAIIQAGYDKRWAILAPEGLQEGQSIIGPKLIETAKTFNIGEVRPIKEVSLGQAIHNIDGKYIRAAGTQGIIQRR